MDKSYTKQIQDFLPGLLSTILKTVTGNAPLASPLPQGDVLGTNTSTNIPAVASQDTAPAPNFQDRANKIMGYFSDQLGSQNPARKNVSQYFPILQEVPYLQQKEEETGRPGLSTLLALQSLFESSGGRTGNPFGVKPEGESRTFPNIKAGIDYQLSDKVLGGGANKSLDILSGKGQITPEEIKKMYEKYNPNSPYVNKLIDAYKYVEGM